MAYDAIIIGAGHNGLITAAMLARAGKKVLVLERRAIVGGASVTEELAPGFRCSTLAYTPGMFQSEIAQKLDLKKLGFETLEFDPEVAAPHPDNGSLVFWKDMQKCVESIARVSQKDARSYIKFQNDMSRIIRFLRPLWNAQLPDPATVGAGDLFELLRLGWKLKGVREKDALQMLRILPMSIADLLNEYFENDHLKGVLASEGIMGSFYGPRSQGSVYVMSYLRMGRGDNSRQSWPLVKGGMGALSEAIASAAKAAGAEIRTGAEVSRINVKNGMADGVTLSGGEEIQAKVIVSNADAKRTFLQMVDPTNFEPHFILKVRNIRARGVSAKVNLALDRYPQWKDAFDGVTTPVNVLIAPGVDYLEKAFDDAKYGDFSKAPFLEIAIPTIVDPSLAPEGKHVMSVYVLFAPYHLKQGDWNAKRDALGDTVIKTIEQYAPGFSSSILHKQVITPLDLESEYGLTEGHIHHGELALDQIMFMRPVPGYARYRTPIQNLYLCSAATHPGGGVTGLPGYLASQEILSDM